MARKSQTIEAIQAARIKAEELLRQLQEREREALAAQADAGKSTLIAAINRVKVAELSRADATTIARAVAKHGGETVASVEALVARLADLCEAGDHLVFMSNGGFEGAPRRTLAALAAVHSDA